MMRSFKINTYVLSCSPLVSGEGEGGSVPTQLRGSEIVCSTDCCLLSWSLDFETRYIEENPGTDLNPCVSFH